MPRYEFHCYNENAEFLGMQVEDHRTDSAARYAAAKRAKQDQGPVDLAYAGDGPWEDRYLTTISPSEFHATGWRAERLT